MIPTLIKHESPGGPYWYHPDHPDCQDGKVLWEALSDTPLTDAAILPEGEYKGHLVWADFAYTLERKLNAASEIIRRLAEWSEKYPRQQVHSFSAKVDEQLIEIESAAKAWLDGHNKEDYDLLAEAGGRMDDFTRCGGKEGQ